MLTADHQAVDADVIGIPQPPKGRNFDREKKGSK